MKKIVLFVFMIITSVNLFSEEIPDYIILDFKTTANLYELVIEDAKYKDFKIEDESVYESSFYDDTFGYIFYQIITYGNTENEIFNIYHEEKIYSRVLCEKEMFPDYFFTVGVTKVYDREDILYSISFFEEDDDYLFVSLFDHRTNERYTL